MKGYCSCGKIIDEVEYSQFGICIYCWQKSEYEGAPHMQETGITAGIVAGRTDTDRK